MRLPEHRLQGPRPVSDTGGKRRSVERAQKRLAALQERLRFLDVRHKARVLRSERGAELIRERFDDRVPKARAVLVRQRALG
jgi:hypothetical protein